MHKGRETVYVIAETFTNTVPEMQRICSVTLFKRENSRKEWKGGGAWGGGGGCSGRDRVNLSFVLLSVNKHNWWEMSRGDGREGGGGREGG